MSRFEMSGAAASVWTRWCLGYGFTEEVTRVISPWPLQDVSALVFTAIFFFYNPGTSTPCLDDQVKNMAQTQNYVRFLTFPVLLCASISLLKPIFPQNGLCLGSSLMARLR